MPLLLPTRLRISTCLSVGVVAQLILRSGVTGLVLPVPGAARSAHSAAFSEPLFASPADKGDSSMPFPTGTKPVKEVDSPRPKLWIYDHCPYCIRPR